MQKNKTKKQQREFDPPERQVSVKLPNNKTVKLSVTAEDTVSQLKEKLDNRQSKPPRFGNLLVMENVTLIDDVKFGELDLSEEKVISVKPLTGL